MKRLHELELSIETAWCPLLEHFDRCRTQAESFENIRDIDQVAHHGALFDGRWHYDRISWKHRNMVEVVIGKQRAFGKVAVLMAHDRAIGAQDELAIPVGISGPGRRRGAYSPSRACRSHRRMRLRSTPVPGRRRSTASWAPQTGRHLPAPDREARRCLSQSGFSWKTMRPVGWAWRSRAKVARASRSGLLRCCSVSVGQSGRRERSRTRRDLPFQRIGILDNPLAL